jgi:hypothetical protein
MIEAMAVAAGLTAGADWRLMGLAAAAVWAPVPSAVALVVAGVAGRDCRRLIREIYRGLSFMERISASRTFDSRTVRAGRPSVTVGRACGALCARDGSMNQK